MIFDQNKNWQLLMIPYEVECTVFFVLKHEVLQLLSVLRCCYLVRASFPFRAMQSRFPSPLAVETGPPSPVFSLSFLFFFSSSLPLSSTLHPPITSIPPRYLKHTISIRSILFLHINLHLLLHQSEQLSKCICVTFSSFPLSLWQSVALLAAYPRRTCLSITLPSSLLFKMTSTSGSW